MNFARQAFFTAMIFIVCGCKSAPTGPNVIGTWTTSPSLGTSKKVQLGLKDDMRFWLVMVFPISGSWSQSGSTIQLDMLDVMGPKDRVGKSMTLTLSKDGQSLSGHFQNDPSEIVLYRDKI